VIFNNLKDLCVDVVVPDYIPRLPRERPRPFEQIASLAAIVTLAESLPEQLPMREELRRVATRALDAAVTDLGDDVKLHKAEVDSNTPSRP